MVRILISAADYLFDKVKTGSVDGYVDAGCVLIKMSRTFKFGLWLHRRFGLSRLLERTLGDRFESLLVLQLVLQRLIAYNHASIAALFGEHTHRMLDTLLSSRLEAMEAALAAVELQYPLYTAALRHHYLKRAEIRFREDAYRQRLEESLISLEVYNDLQRALRSQRQALDRRPPLDLGLKLAEMVGRVPMFASLDDKRLADVARMLRPRLAVPGERVIVKGDRGDNMYFIASGEMVVRTAGGPIRLGTGDFFGEMALLSRQPRNADVAAAGYVQLLALEGRDFRKLLRMNPDIRTEIERVAAERRDAAAVREVAE
jgi:CPA1 family monovalent cation:H+ antiporter